MSSWPLHGPEMVVVMADMNVNPVVFVVGEKRGGGRSQFTDKASGEVTDRYRILVLTSGGFLQVTVPRALWSVEFEDGELVELEVGVNSWSFNDRTGTAFILNRVVSKSLPKP